HRATFLATALTSAAAQEVLAPYVARLLSVIVFDQLVRHPVVTLGDHDDGRLLDAQHPQIEDSIDWFFRVSRRHEVLWFELSVDPARPSVPVLRSRRPHGDARVADQIGASGGEWSASAGQVLSQQLGQCLAQWLQARRLPPVGPLAVFTVDDLCSVAQ